MYIISSDDFGKLPEDVQTAVSEVGKEITDDTTVKEIEGIMGAKGPEDEDAENNMDDVVYGDEGEYANKMDSEGRMEDMPESAKNKIKSFDEGWERGNALIRKMGEDKVEKIPMNKKAPDEKKPTY